jgi:hypothetical protein
LCHNDSRTPLQICRAEISSDPRAGQRLRHHEIITAGITWLIGLLNPAAAFIKACKLIYDIIMFFVTNAERITKFVNTVIDSVADIVRGNIGGVVAKIETYWARWCQF